MTNKLKCVLLIDDDEPTNFLNEMLVRQAGCAEKCISVQSGQDALDYLKSAKLGNQPQPNLIFLDINMPAMNGWEFLAHYSKIGRTENGRAVIVMLTTSQNPDDGKKADFIEGVDGFYHKPLTAAMLHEIIEKHFADLQ